VRLLLPPMQLPVPPLSKQASFPLRESLSALAFVLA